MPSTHVENLLAILPPLPPGTIVVFNTETGDYIIGSTEDQALEAFGEKYDWGVPAYVHVVH